MTFQTCMDFAENASFASFGIIFNFADSKLLDFSRLPLVYASTYK